MPDDDSSLRIPPQAQQIGPFGIFDDGTTLSLRFKERGELSFNGCLVIALLLCSVFLFGALAIFQFASESAAQTTHYATRAAISPTQILQPDENHFGLLWLFSALGVLVAIPFYVARTYRSLLVYTFRRSDDVLLRNNRVITNLRRIERIVIEEATDPDGRFLYDLSLIYADGRELSLHTGYDEREVKNIANEISKFVGVQILWREAHRAAPS